MCAAAASPGTLPALDVPITRVTRLLVVSPHPDDGSLAGAGLMQRVLSHGGSVRVVHVTSGDAFSTGVELVDRIERPTAGDYRHYGALRERESVNALGTLGVRRQHITFLGFPDDGLCMMVGRAHAPSAAFVSPYTRRSRPPAGEQIERGVAYRADDVVRELADVVRSFRPTIVLAPDSYDEHPDHCSTHLLVHDALAAAADLRRPAPLVLHYLIHFGAWPGDLPSRDGLTLPARLAPDATRWRTLPLTPRESAIKRRALAAYKSQVLAIAPLFDALERTNELFAVGDPDRVAACWCAGEDIAGRPPRARQTNAPKQ